VKAVGVKADRSLQAVALFFSAYDLAVKWTGLYGMRPLLSAV